MGQSASLGVVTYSFSNDVPASNRRQDEIQSTTLRVGTLETECGRQLCLVRNISRGGLRARVYRRFKIGTRATVELKTGNRVNGRVVWAQAEHIGIKFNVPVDVEAVLSTETLAAKGFQARLPRIECHRRVTLRSGADLYRCLAVDVSQGGMKIESSAQLPIGPAVVTIPALYPVSGSIRWSTSGFAGIAFDELIPFRRLLDWTRATGDALNGDNMSEPVPAPL